MTSSVRLLLGDSVTLLDKEARDSVDLAVFSPPFASLYAYSAAVQDMGNARECDDEFLAHFDFFCRALVPVIKPGRNICIHLQQVARLKSVHGHLGLFDLRGAVIRAMEDAGAWFYGEAAIDKCPQAQAIRTKSQALLFTQLRKDALVSRPALADWLVIFKRPGDAAEPVRPDLTNDEWIEWARPLWRGIRESDTLNVEAARSESDERHVCPLQLSFIERCVRLWSNPGDLVLSPFCGIGSEGYVAVKHGRSFLGMDLNERYLGVARKNIDDAMADLAAPQQELFA